MALAFSDVFPPRPARLHEACGPAATGFACAVAGALEGEILWIREGWRAGGLNPVGLSRFFAPERLLLARVKDHAQGLACAEEALRDGALGLVVIELGEALDLLRGRRLLLAAKDGQTTGVALIPEGAGANAAETRWRCAPVFDAATAPEDSTLQAWELIKNKSGTLGSWHVRWNAPSRRLDVVSPAGE